MTACEQSAEVRASLEVRDAADCRLLDGTNTGTWSGGVTCLADVSICLDRDAEALAECPGPGVFEGDPPSYCRCAHTGIPMIDVCVSTTELRESWAPVMVAIVLMWALATAIRWARMA